MELIKKSYIERVEKCIDGSIQVREVVDHYEDLEGDIQKSEYRRYVVPREKDLCDDVKAFLKENEIINLGIKDLNEAPGVKGDNGKRS